MATDMQRVMATMQKGCANSSTVRVPVDDSETLDHFLFLYFLPVKTLSARESILCSISSGHRLAIVNSL